jgi:hypothetical protein
VNDGTPLSSSEKISSLLALLEHVRSIDHSCREIATNKEMSYFTNNIQTYLEGIVGTVETDIKEILMTEFLEGNILIKHKDVTAPDKSIGIHEMVVNSVYPSHIKKLDEL